MSTQTLKEKIVKASTITLSLSFLGSVFAYLIRVLYSHALSIEDYGLFYAALSLFLLFTTYLDLGFGYASVYLIPKYLKRKDYGKAWNVFIYGQAVSLLMSVIISFTLIISAPFIAKYYFKIAGSEILIYIFCIFLIASSLINGMIQIYSGMQKEKYYASITLFRWFFTLILSLLFIIAGIANIIFFAIAWSLGNLTVALIYLAVLYFRHTYLVANKIVWQKDIFKTMFSLATPAILETFISSIFLMTITFFLTLFKGVTEVAIYNIIFPLASIPIVLLTPLNTLLLPLISHLYEGEKDKIKFLTEQILKLVPFIGAYFSLFIILFPSASVSLIFGTKWLGKVEASLFILSLGIIFLLLCGILGVIALGIGKVKERLRIAMIIAIVSFPINIFLILRFAVLGAVLSIGLFAIVLNWLFLKLIRKDLPVKIPYRFYIYLFIFSAGIFFFTRAIKFSPQNWIQFIVAGMIYTIVYILFGYVLKVFDKSLLLMLLPKGLVKVFLPLNK